MSVTAISTLKANTPAALETLVNAQIALGKQPFGPMHRVEGDGSPYWAQQVTTGVVENSNITLQSQLLSTEVITITTAQLLALFTTPIQLIGAPGSGKAIVPAFAIAFLDFNTTAYDGIASNEDLVLRFTDASGNIAGTIEATGFLEAAADAHRVAQFASLAVPTANAALMLHMTTGNIATGNSPLKIKVFYRVVDLLT